MLLHDVIDNQRAKMSKKLSMGIALALMAAIPTQSVAVHSGHVPYYRKEQWQGQGKRKKPKSR